MTVQSLRMWLFSVSVILLLEVYTGNGESVNKYSGVITENGHNREKRHMQWISYPWSNQQRNISTYHQDDDHVYKSVASTTDLYYVRLVGGETDNEGRVEVRKNHGSWGMICDDGDWNATAAHVVCRMLGYRGVMSVYEKANQKFGSGDNFLMDDVHCSGREDNIGECRYSWDHHNCNEEIEAAGVTCLIDSINEDHPECFTLPNGADYRGTVSQTISGIPCQAWNTQTPHSHQFDPISFPNFGIGDHNYCRSFGRGMATWCFTLDIQIRYEYCSIGDSQPRCKNPVSPECYTNMNGTDYRGYVMQTSLGGNCLKWTDQSILMHSFTPENYPNQGLGEHNFCRNVNGDSGPWCVTDDPHSPSHKEYCNVADPMPSCDRPVPMSTDGDPLQSFWVVNRAALPGNNRRVIINVSPSSCARFCLIEDDFTCRSFDYSRHLQRCWLSDQNSHLTLLTFEGGVESFTYYERIDIGPVGEFQMTSNMALRGNGFEDLPDVSLLTCASACLMAPFGCASCDYDRASRYCWLYNVEQAAGLLGIFQNNPYDHFGRKGLAKADCYTGSGSDYRGYVSQTEQGFKCINWQAAAGYSVGVTTAMYPDGDIGDHNYCRNPDNDTMPWCYFGNSQVLVTSWGYCDIAICIEVTSPTTPWIPQITMLSEGKDTYQSSTLNKKGVVAHASLAVDGNLDPDFRAGSCSSTERKLDSWWYVDLGGLYNVEYVDITNTFENSLRLRRTVITVGKNLLDSSSFIECGTIKKSHAQASMDDPSRFIRITCGELLLGQYVKFQMKRRDFLNLCEVQVWGYEAMLTCAPRHFMCDSGNECISDTFTCDREYDCADESDEANCDYPMEQFRKFEDKAIPNVDPIKSYMNKLEVDCAEICIEEQSFVCYSFEYNVVAQSCNFFNKTRANSGGFVIMTGFDHYERISLTPNCILEGEQLHPCPGGNCIEQSWLCDNDNDCGDFSDESNCGYDDQFSIHLGNGTAAHEGRVEVNYRGQWGLVCDDSWDIQDAHVVCKELGYKRGAARAVQVAEFGHGNLTAILMDDVNCVGTEASLKECPFKGWGDHNCVRGESAGVLCRPNEDCRDDQFTCPNLLCVDQINVCDEINNCGDLADERNCGADIEDVRLLGNSSDENGRGRLEVFYRNQWGTVCDSNFTTVNALVVCKQLGYTGDVHVYRITNAARSEGPVVMDYVDCVGTELSLADCSFIPASQTGCTHQQDIGIACGTAEIFPTDLCGVTNFNNGQQFRIVGGSSAKHGSWPWQAQLLRKGDDALICGATLIDEFHVLSAAHCFQRFEESTFKVRFGEHDIRYFETTQQDFTIDCLFKHPQYDTSTTNNDIVLIRLNKKQQRGVVSTPYVRPICLPEPNEFDDGHNCWISGWGNTGRDSYPHMLQEAKVPLLPRNVCTSWNVYGSKLTEKMLCAGTLQGGVDTCDGDSGGPLQCKNHDTGVWKLWGITSWGYGCAQPNAPGVYTKVTEYLDWIEEKRNTKSCY